MKFNTMLDVAFTVDHDFDDDHQLIETDEGIAIVLDALRQRLEILTAHRSECAEAFGICDTYGRGDDHE